MTTHRQFVRGDLVRWRTQGNGERKSQVGVVVLVVPAGIPLAPLLPSLADRYNLRPIAAGSPRSEQSYLVARTGGRGRAKLHWPHSSALRPYEDPDNAKDETPSLLD